MNVFIRTIISVLFVICIVSFINDKNTSEITASIQNTNPKQSNMESLIVEKEDGFELMKITPEDYFLFLNKKHLYTNTEEPNMNKSGSNIIARRTAKKAPSYCLPIIHANHPDLIDRWDGIEKFETFLFRNNYLINPDGDDIFEFSKDDEFRVLFTKK
jgi:hypothetical protein